MTDLRVQLHKKRRQQNPPPKIESNDDFDSDDRDSLENAHISDVDNDDKVPNVRKRLQISNRIVQKTGSPRKVSAEPLTPEKSKIR